jgi:hypothetical protein
LKLGLLQSYPCLPEGIPLFSGQGSPAIFFGTYSVKSVPERSFTIGFEADSFSLDFKLLVVNHWFSSKDRFFSCSISFFGLASQT